MTEIWERLSALMAKHGLSKSDVARIAKVTPSAVTTWARGGRISPVIAKRLSDHFGTDLTGLISNLIPSKSVILAAESREKYGSVSRDDIDSIVRAINNLSDRVSAMEQLLIKTLAENKKS
jgi:transcriptional regulator with XRE-family HTH domain